LLGKAYQAIRNITWTGFAYAGYYWDHQSNNINYKTKWR